MLSPPYAAHEHTQRHGSRAHRHTHTRAHSHTVTHIRLQQHSYPDVQSPSYRASKYTPQTHTLTQRTVPRKASAYERHSGMGRVGSVLRCFYCHCLGQEVAPLTFGGLYGEGASFTHRDVSSGPVLGPVGVARGVVQALGKVRDSCGVLWQRQYALVGRAAGVRQIWGPVLSLTSLRGCDLGHMTSPLVLKGK